MEVKTVVIADDEPIFRLDVRGILEDAGITVSGEAEDGFDAVEACRRTHPDVAIFDVKMPVFDGMSAAKTVIEEKLVGAVVLLTAYSDDALISEAGAIGVTGYLMKPLDARLMRPTLEVAFAQAKRFTESQSRADELKKKLEDNKTLEIAKSFVAKERGITESEAYRLMQKMSMEKQVPLVEIALAAIKPKLELNAAKKMLMAKKGWSEERAYRALTDNVKSCGSVKKALEKLLND